MDILNNFGIKPVLLVAQIVNFLIILYIIKKFLLKPILEVLDKRKLSIKEGLKQAEDSKILLEKTSIHEKEILKQAREESKKLLEETKKQRDQIIRDAENSAKQQAQKILEDAKKQIYFEAKEAQKELSMQISGLTVEFLQKSASQIFTKADQENVIKNALEKLKKRVD
jgi:F-type H+-transporting ATPase subunit b